MRLIDIESESFLDEMREKQNACKEIIHNSDGEKTTWTERDHWEGVYGVFVEMALTLRKQPTIDAAPVKHGRWEEPEPEGVWSWDKRAYAQCSLCKKKSYLGWTDNYCRYCGAKMDLEGLDDRRDQQGNAEK